MDAEKLAAVRQLQQRFPALTVSEARELLQSHRWNVTAAAAAAATRERDHATASREGAQAYFVGGAGQGGSAQQVIAAPSQPHTSNNNNNNNNNTSESVTEGDVQRLIEQVFAKAARRAGAEGGGGDHRDYLTAKGTAGAAAAAAAARDVADTGDDKGDDDDDDGGGGDADDADGARVQAFYGHGRRLGYTSHPSPMMAPTLRRTRSVVIAAYRNGFLIDDTLFVPLQGADGAAFARALQQGHIPDILAQRYPDCDITAKLHDCMTQDYSAPSYTAFTGTGHRLSSGSGSGGASSSTTTTTAAPSALATASSSATTTAPAATHVPTLDVVEGGDDVTTVCLVTTAGAKHEVRVNATRHTVDDLYRVASALQQQQQQQPSASPALLLVVRDRPPRKLSSDTRTMTIEQAKLKRAVVMIQKDTS